MILDTQVELGTNRGSKDSIGGYPTAAFSRTKYLNASVQPLGGEAQMATYGLDLSDEPLRLFTEVDTAILEGQQIRVSTTIYTIVAVQAWPRHYEVIIKRVH